jgi:potassium-transporting ATPase KdpC subunit
MKNKSAAVALRLFAVMTIVCGILYPAAITVFGRLAFPWQAGGSILYRESKPIGSLLIAQPSPGPGYFSPRPSAGNYATVPSAASNLALSSAALRDSISARRASWKNSVGKPPPDLVFSSGSGLDPHISPEAALFQAERITLKRGYSPRHFNEIKSVISRRTEGPQLGVLGEARVNVLLLNFDLDGIMTKRMR